ncbi:hypothetical protein [Paracoccus yeei]|uniref:Cupin domain-containing protein n=2 Tax=Paracoccus yeei TaxID=147645 RepID=A0A2D2C2B6_9RHOB|nr:hypothetical protein [Paracoccus yeei]ATQ56637.1 hypothetical protein PYTT13_13100 [Paracoccus yeei]
MSLLLGKSTYPLVQISAATSLGVLHRFTAADGPDSDPHDHPFAADIVILSCGYVEHVFDLDQPYDPPLEAERRGGDCFHNEACTIHRIIRLTAPEGLDAVPAGAA